VRARGRRRCSSSPPASSALRAGPSSCTGRTWALSAKRRSPCCAGESASSSRTISCSSTATPSTTWRCPCASRDSRATTSRVAGDGIGRRVRAALDKVGLLERERAMPVALSGGEQQRLCIARAIVNRPSILIADEPTGNLDPEYAKAILELFQSFHRVGVTVLMSTHDEASVERLGCRRVALAAGALAP